MDDNERAFQRSKLYMPANLQTENQIISGIGKKESKYFLYLFIFSLAIGFLVGIFTSMKAIILVTIPMSFFSYLLVVKNPDNNYSTMTQLVGVYIYFTKQNKYKYKYKEWWEKDA